MTELNGYVYFIISSPNDGALRCKIGFTKGDPELRLRDLQCGSPSKLAIYTAIQGSKKIERLFHETFAPLRIHGEWFAVKGKLKVFLLYLMDDAMTRKPTPWQGVYEAIYDVILSDDLFCQDEDPVEYAASADKSKWEWMRPALEAADQR